MRYRLIKKGNMYLVITYRTISVKEPGPIKKLGNKGYFNRRKIK